MLASDEQSIDGLVHEPVVLDLVQFLGLQAVRPLRLGLLGLVYVLAVMHSQL